MDPEVRESKPGACPKCGMALEPETIAAPATRIEYVCPMHPEIVRDEPGSCPICGMALEPRTVTLAEAPNPELVDMTRRFWISAALSLPLFILAMSDMVRGRTVAAFVLSAFAHMDSTRHCHASGALGRLAVYRARLAFDREQKSQHVYVDRHRRWRGLSV